MPFHCSELHLTKLWVPNKDQSKQASVAAADPSSVHSFSEVLPIRSPHSESETRDQSNLDITETIEGVTLRDREEGGGSKKSEGSVNGNYFIQIYKMKLPLF